ncbi:unnamed protein product, partial [Closterium sp. Naga37s-1]
SKPVPSLSNAKSSVDHGNESSIKFLTYEDIKRATDNFANVLGEGGFGKVYKGRLRGVNGEADEETTFVAIKVLAPHSFQGMDEFLNEITTVEGVQHPNIVRLLACCTEKVKALVYEFIPMGDVDAWLAKCSDGKAKFSWADRMKVIMGTAEAMTFIHKQRFIHRDFKSSNVLLTEDFTPKVADFGLAKGIEDWKTHVTTRVMGSMGYIDPTYFESGHLCDKSDVFAFGLFMVEILAGKSVLRQETSNYPVKKAVGAGFPEYTYDEMMLITDRLKKPIGQGGFGTVCPPSCCSTGGANGGGATVVTNVLLLYAYFPSLSHSSLCPFHLSHSSMSHSSISHSPLSHSPLSHSPLSHSPLPCLTRLSHPSRPSLPLPIHQAGLMAMEQLSHPTILSMYGYCPTSFILFPCSSPPLLFPTPSAPFPTSLPIHQAELMAMEQLSHPTILSLYGYCPTSFILFPCSSPPLIFPTPSAPFPTSLPIHQAELMAMEQLSHPTILSFCAHPSPPPLPTIFLFHYLLTVSPSPYLLLPGRPSQAELMAMEQLSHPTILSLYGYVAKPTPALIYEFITNGNAEAYLRRAVQGKAEFSWKARLRVALMCAEALQVMHSHNYVHRDFKASNVLLREDLTPVLADFGLARTVNNWQSHVTTRVMGSTGYIDPVYFESGHLNAKCDTYAFGIFLLELVTGMLVTDKNFEALRMTLATGADLPEADKVIDQTLVRARADGEISLLLDFSKVFSSTPAPGEPVVSVDNETSENYTIITVSAPNRPGLLQLLTLTFRDLGLDVGKAVVDLDDDGNVADAFYVTAVDGKKITQKRDLQNIRKCVVRALVLDAKNDAPKDSSVRPARLIRPVTSLDPSASPELKRRTELLHNLMDTYIKNDVLSIQRSIVDHVEYTMARSRYKFDDFEAYQATAYSVRDRLIESWNDTQQYFKDQDSKRVYYLSMEFLMGRSLLNSIFNLGMKDQYVEALGQLGFSKLELLLIRDCNYDQYVEALGQLGYKLEVLAEQERDAALGNGGLGRLAACVLDSMATLNYPGWGTAYSGRRCRSALTMCFPPNSFPNFLFLPPPLPPPLFPSYGIRYQNGIYGIRYQYGMFRQTLQDGFQHEQPDYWLTFGNPWEIERVFVTYPVRFYGTVESYTEAGHPRKRWVEGETVEAVAYDNPIPGYHTNNTINLRLWGAKPSGEFDLQSFNTGDYVNAILSKQKAEAISSVLYPDDRTYQGKELRLKQQHFFVSATMQDVVRRYKEEHATFDEFKDKVALQLNDTHPVLALVELMRLLVDEEGLEWGYAWNITTHTFSYTNHTVLPEALEKWPVEILETLLPRHLEIMYDINHNFIVDLKKRIGNDYDRLSRMSIIEEGAHKSIRMATLAVVTCHTINGVSQIHTDLIENTLFKDFYDIWPHKFQNKTNGVTQRRWLAFCNPGLAGILTQWLGTESWITNLDLVAGLKEHVDDPLLQTQWMQVRRQNKARLAAYIEGISGIKVSIDAMFDVQVKRIHEYKRQLLNVMSIIHRYDCIKKMSPEDRKRVVPRVCLLGGKAAPGYDLAKKIVKLISAVSEVINNDEDVGDLLKLVFIPDYNVSLAELIIPASDLSQHISTAGNEASGTSNMKFAMNGCLILGTLDGATREIREEIGPENMFVFGAETKDVPRLREERRTFTPCRNFTRVVGMIRSGYFGWTEFFAPLMDSIDGPGNDYYLLANDFPTYLQAQAAIDATYVDVPKWTRMSISSTAGCGRFTSDRTIKEYAEEIWDVEPVTRPY